MNAMQWHSLTAKPSTCPVNLYATVSTIFLRTYAEEKKVRWYNVYFVPGTAVDLHC